MRRPPLPPVPPGVAESQWFRRINRLTDYELACTARCEWLDEAEKIADEQDFPECSYCCSEAGDSMPEAYLAALSNAAAWKQWVTDVNAETAFEEKS